MANVFDNDVLIYAKTFPGMIERLREILKRLKQAHLKLRLNKCRFCQSEVTYLGHVISEKGISPDPEKIKAILEIPEPKTAKEVKSFLGLPSYYRKFIQGCSQISAPLIKLLKKNAVFQWETEQQEAFDKLKQALVTALILAHPRFDKKFILQTDGSGIRIGAVLSQLDENGIEHPVAYASKSLGKSEKNYGITELETLAVVKFVKYFQPYLYNEEVTIYTDHTAVKSVLGKENPLLRIAHWRLPLSGIKMEIVPRKGTANGNADALSRNPIDSLKTKFDIEEAIPPQTSEINETTMSVSSNILPVIVVTDFSLNGVTNDDTVKLCYNRPPI